MEEGEETVNNIYLFIIIIYYVKELFRRVFSPSTICAHCECLNKSNM